MSFTSSFWKADQAAHQCNFVAGGATKVQNSVCQALSFVPVWVHVQHGETYSNRFVWGRSSNRALNREIDACFYGRGDWEKEEEVFVFNIVSATL